MMARPMSERRVLVLSLRRDKHLTFREIGQHLGVSGARAQQLFVGAERQERLARWHQERVTSPQGIAEQQRRLAREELFGVLSHRVANAVWRAGLTVSDVRTMAYEDLRRVRNLGEGGLTEIRARGLRGE